MGGDALAPLPPQAGTRPLPRIGPPAIGPVVDPPAPAKVPEPPAPPAVAEQPKESIRFNRFSSFDLFDPTAGVSFDFKARAQSNVPATQIIDEAGQKPDKDHPLASPLVRDYRGGVDVSTSLRMNQPNWFFGVGGDVQAAVQTQGVDANKGAFAQVYDQAEALKKDYSGLQKQIQGLQTQLANDPAIKQAQSLIQQLQTNPTNQQALQQLRGLLQSGSIQKTLDSVASVIGKTNQSLGKINGAASALGDGTRTLMADATVKGALEMQAGYRSDPHQLGNGWSARFGVAGSVILPVPNYGQNAGVPGLDQFRYAMVQVSAQAQMTTSGLNQLAGDLGNLQQNLGNLQNTLQATKGQVNQATAIIGQNTPNLGQAAAVAQQLQQSTAQAAATSLQIAGNLQNLQQDIGQVQATPRLTLTTVTPTSPIGIGIRQAGASFQGPLTPWLRARVDVNVYNPVGILPGEEKRYNLSINPSGNLADLLPTSAFPNQPNRGGQKANPQLDLVSSTQRNVFHDFYQPAVGTQIGLKAFPDRWFSPELQVGLRQGFDGQAPGAEVMYTQNLGPMSLTSGVLMPTIGQSDQNFYSAELGVGNVFSLGAGTQSFTDLTGVQTNMSVRIPGQDVYFRGMVAPTEQRDGRAGIEGFGTVGGTW